MRFPCKVKNSSGPKVVTWADGTDEEIAAMLEAHYNGDIDIHDYWTVGDERTVHLSAMSATGVNESHAAQDTIYLLSNAGGKMLADGITECAFQVDAKRCLFEKGYMNSSRTNVGGWKQSARRTWCNEVYKNAIPATLRNIFKEFINQTSIGNNTSTIENTYDIFSLRSEIEVFGSNKSSFSGEGTEVEWYKTTSNRVGKDMNGNSINWFERSPSQSTDRFCYVNGGTSSANYADKDNGIIVFGCI